MSSKFTAIASLIVIFALAIAVIIFYKSLESDETVEFDTEQIASEHKVIHSSIAPRLIFPRRNTIIGDTFETFPFILQPAKSDTKITIYYGDNEMEVLLQDEFHRIDVPVKKGVNTFVVVYENKSGDYISMAIPTVEMLPAADVRAMLASIKMEAEGQPLLNLGYYFDITGLDFIHFDEEPPFIFLTPVILACATDVDVHRPLNQNDNQPLIAEGQDFSHGAYTLRNDDGDWTVGASANIQQDALPVATLATDIDRTNNANENDLVKVDVHNLLGHQRIYVFAFPVQVEADRNLNTPVRAANGNQATNQQLAYWQDAAKARPAANLPLLVPKGTTSFWLEGLLGGRYRIVTGYVPPGINPGQVSYNVQNGLTRPLLGCMRQATVTVPVIDIFQDGTQSPNRLTAFDVMWGGRPYFMAKLWPPGGKYQWGADYKLGTTSHTIPGIPIDGTYASMKRDTIENEPSAGATIDGYANVKMQGTAGNGNKAEIVGGFQVINDNNDTTPNDAVPQANGSARDRYPDRISLAYEVDKEKLVRPEHLQVIIPQLSGPPAAQSVMGNTLSVSSQVQYTIQDAYRRTIRAGSVKEYLDFYGAGLKAWEALGIISTSPPPPCSPIPVRQRGVAPPDLTEGPRRNDLLTLNNVHPNNNSITFGRRNRPGTAQRSQAHVRADRMTAGTFTDTLRFVTRTNRNKRYLDWQHWTGNDTNAEVTRVRTEAQQRMNNYNAAGSNVTALAPLSAADAARTTRHQVLNICQDVILQIRLGDVNQNNRTDDHLDLNVLETNNIIIYSPYFFENFNPTNSHMRPFSFHLQFTPGNITSRLVGINHLRIPP